MKILITTGIYPPQIGGPAQYAKNVKEAFERAGHTVSVLTYGKIERMLPSGLRHNYFSSRVFWKLFGSDFCVALDTFSVGWPTVFAAKILRKKVIIRTGGDFLWESYVERTGDLVLFREFYNRKNLFSPKDRMIFEITRWTLQNAALVVFSTEWQREIFIKAYDLNKAKTVIIENFYGEKLESVEPIKKDFLAFTRNLKWKNIDVLKKVFEEAKKTNPELILDTEMVEYSESIEKMKKAYAVILVSLGDISPNMILDALRCNKPFILTKETGLKEKLKNVALFVDPKNEKDIKEKILFLSNDTNYKTYKEKVKNFTFTHSWEEIANEFLDAYKKL